MVVVEASQTAVTEMVGSGRALNNVTSFAPSASGLTVTGACLLVAYVHTNGPRTPTGVSAGWTLIEDGSNTNSRLFCAYRIATSAGTENCTFELSAADNCVGAISAFAETAGPTDAEAALTDLLESAAGELDQFPPVDASAAFTDLVEAAAGTADQVEPIDAAASLVDLMESVAGELDQVQATDASAALVDLMEGIAAAAEVEPAPPVEATPIAQPDAVAVLLHSDPPRLFSDLPLMTPVPGVAGLQCADDRLAGEIRFTRSVTVTPWGSASPSGGLGAIELANDDGALGGLPGLLRDTPISIHIGANTLFLDQMDLAATAVVDRIEAPDESTLRIVAADPLALLDRALTTRSYGGSEPEALRGRPQVIAVGAALSCPLPMIRTATLVFALHDGPIAGVEVVRDRGVELPEGTHYLIDHSTPHAGLRHIVGGEDFPRLITVDFAGGALRRLSDFITREEGDFGELKWTDAPEGWDITGADEGRFITLSSGGANFQSDGSGFLALVWGGGTTSDAVAYYYEVEISALTSGGLVLGDGTFWASLESVGLHRGCMLSPAGSFFSIAAAVSGCDVDLESIRVMAVRPIHRLTDIVHYLCCERLVYDAEGHAEVEPGPLSLEQVDWGSVEALDAAAPYDLAFWVDGARTRRDVLREVLDAFCGDAWSDLQGRLKVGRLVAPEDAGEPDLIIEADAVAGDIVPAADTAPGLSTIIAGQRNWYVHSAADIASSVTPAVASSLMADFRIRRSGDASVSDDYGHAIGAPGASRPDPGLAARKRTASDAGAPTLLVKAADCQAEATRRVVLYGAPKSFFRVPVELHSQQAHSLDPFRPVLVYGDRWGFESGRLAVVRSVEGALADGGVVLSLWTEAQAEAEED